MMRSWAIPIGVETALGTADPAEDAALLLAPPWISSDSISFRSWLTVVPPGFEPAALAAWPTAALRWRGVEVPDAGFDAFAAAAAFFAATMQAIPVESVCEKSGKEE